MQHASLEERWFPAAALSGALLAAGVAISRALITAPLAAGALLLPA
jgi:hypothetical protein